GAAALGDAAGRGTAATDLLRDLAIAEGARARESRDPAVWTRVAQAFARAMEEGEGDPALLAGYALAHARLGKPEAAESFYKKAAETRGDLPASLATAVARFLPGHEDLGARPATREPIAAIALSADGHLAAVGSQAGEICVLDLGQGAVLHAVEGMAPR